MWVVLLMLLATCEVFFLFLLQSERLLESAQSEWQSHQPGGPP